MGVTLEDVGPAWSPAKMAVGRGMSVARPAARGIRHTSGPGQNIDYCISRSYGSQSKIRPGKIEQRVLLEGLNSVAMSAFSREWFVAIPFPFSSKG